MIRDQAKFSFKRALIAIVFVAQMIAFVACQQSKPDGIMSEKKMVQTLAKLYVAEEKVSRVSIPYDSVKKIFPYFSDRVFREMNVDDSVFRESWNYYLTQPDRLEAIYAALIDSLNLREQGFPSTRPSKSDALPK